MTKRIARSPARAAPAKQLPRAAPPAARPTRPAPPPNAAAADRTVTLAARAERLGHRPFWLASPSSPSFRITAGRPSSPTVQRLIVAMDRDHVTRDHVEGLQTNTVEMESNIEVGHQEVEPKKGSLKGIGSETLYIVGHGSQKTLSGIAPEKLAKYLVTMGLTPEYNGKIVLVSCFTGLPTKEKDLSTSYAGRLQATLASEYKIRVPISAPKGGAKVTRERSIDKREPFNIRSIYPGQEDEYREASTQVEEEFRKDIRELNERRREVREKSQKIGNELMRLDRELKEHVGTESSLRKEIERVQTEIRELEKLLEKPSESLKETQETALEIGEKIRNLKIEEGTLEDELEEHMKTLHRELNKQEQQRVRQEFLDIGKDLDRFTEEIAILMEQWNQAAQKLASRYFMPLEEGMSHLPRPKEACFLTTACVEALGLPDDGYELTVLRRFRDGFLRSQPEGPALIEEYYALAPEILAAIGSRRDPRSCLVALYDRLVVPSIRHIEAGDDPAALEHYRRVVLELQEQYLGSGRGC